jgi:molecular chaperone GrpE
MVTKTVDEKTVDANVDRSATSESQATVEIAKDEAKDSGSEAASLRDRLMRALAEVENTRRLGERRAEDAERYALTNFARDLLQVVDNLRRAIDAGGENLEPANSKALLEGVAATDRILMQILNRFGLREVKALYEPFDPQKHEAVMETDATDKPPGTITEVLEDGYMLHDRLLRPARVVVAKPRTPSSQAWPSQAAEQ